MPALEAADIQRRVELIYRGLLYDHRPYLPPDVAAFHRTEEYRVGYACFKHAVSLVLQPRSILEIGVGVGVAALAFVEGSREIPAYSGIDNDYEYEKQFSVRPSEFVAALLASRGYHTRIFAQSSDTVNDLPERWYDLVHVDGDHSAAAVEHDVTLAWRMGAKWILCDDARDTEVARGIFSALRALDRGSVDWAYFPDTWTGNILIRTDHKRGE